MKKINSKIKNKKLTKSFKKKNKIQFTKINGEKYYIFVAFFKIIAAFVLAC